MPIVAKLALLLLLAIAASAGAAPSIDRRAARQLQELVPTAPLVLDYHGGRLLTGRGCLMVFLVWYGDFTPAQQSIIVDFLHSFNASNTASPSTYGFWKIISTYTDAASDRVKSSVRLGGQISVGIPLGKSLHRSDIPRVIATALASAKLPAHQKSLYVLLTAADVAVERFCMDSCATHSYLNGSLATRGPRLPYAWVGNSATQCPGMCAWPFALPQYGPRDSQPLVPPNADVGMDGMVINLALMLAGAATNPFGDGYYQGDASVPLESGTACTGIFGTGSYPGYPGELLVDKTSGSSYNAQGLDGRKFLLPAVWSPGLKQCSTGF
ncbi:hypothetical protein SELMODRAFT_87388 [Selaginella moellendorffii]|uniref:Uncharacterized protein n=1 Tax=Selaginella moellendorffii TaxID=88036 RepID=D8R890_SELML|nr:protein EXORDIUM-like 2 [Selaginella moellendorffii]EFJ32020.1 hypothetical protein SELMODRAFT_87388 [Selaginella moellendorffii]|eukprot:XP_002967421.1 protein EXORDIUM-like 2 [Selaginella moellendorffii]